VWQNPSKVSAGKWVVIFEWVVRRIKTQTSFTSAGANQQPKRFYPLGNVCRKNPSKVSAGKWVVIFEWVVRRIAAD
jgi:hypothetical protein